MRRLTVPLVSCAVVLTTSLVAPSAHAEPVVVSRAALPAGFSFVSGNAVDPTDTAGDGSYAHVTEAAAASPPSGLGALRLTSTATSTAALRWSTGDPDDLIASWTVIRRSTPDPGPAHLVASVTKPSGTYYGITQVSVPEGQWAVVDALAPTYSWYTAQLVGVGSDTVAAFADRDPVNDNATGATLSIRQVNSGATLLVDTVRVSTGDPGTTYDFEAPLTATTMITSTTTLTAGRRFLLGTRVTQGAAPLVGAPVELWVRAFGEGDFTLITTRSTDATGRASLSRAPTRRTEYQWRYAGNDLRTQSRSPVATIRVRTRVTLQLVDDTLSPGGTLRARGTTFPAKPGATVTLWRTTASGTTKIGTATVQADGSYAINRTVTTGTWRVHVTVPASGGNLAGTSVTHTATVG